LHNALVALKYKTTLVPFEWNDALSLSAKEHCMDLGPKGMIGETGSSEQSFIDRMYRYG
jgi:uncharacterized protein YkwD